MGNHCRKLVSHPSGLSWLPTQFPILFSFQLSGLRWSRNLSQPVCGYVLCVGMCGCPHLKSCHCPSSVTWYLAWPMFVE